MMLQSVSSEKLYNNLVEIEEQAKNYFQNYVKSLMKKKK